MQPNTTTSVHVLCLVWASHLAQDSLCLPLLALGHKPKAATCRNVAKPSPHARSPTPHPMLLIVRGPVPYATQAVCLALSVSCSGACRGRHHGKATQAPGQAPAGEADSLEMRLCVWPAGDPCAGHVRYVQGLLVAAGAIELDACGAVPLLAAVACLMHCISCTEMQCMPHALHLLDLHQHSCRFFGAFGAAAVRVFMSAQACVQATPRGTSLKLPALQRTS
jgi:hypothetical protein